MEIKYKKNIGAKTLAVKYKWDFVYNLKYTANSFFFASETFFCHFFKSKMIAKLLVKISTLIGVEAHKL